MVRAFSLAEAMVCVAIIGVMAAVAAPSLIDVVWSQRLEGSAETVASAIAAARNEAMTFKRCARVVLEPGRIVVERLNVFDCDAPDTPPQPPRIDPSKPLWIRVAELRIDDPVTLAQGIPWPATLPGSGGAAELRFRPSGRVFSHDDGGGGGGGGALRSSGAVIVLRHPRLPGTGGTKLVGVQRNGLECLMKRGVPVPVIGGDVVCP